MYFIFKRRSEKPTKMATFGFTSSVYFVKNHIDLSENDFLLKILGWMKQLLYCIDILQGL